MKIKTPHGDFDVKEITYAKQRELHRLELKSIDVDSGKLDVDGWMSLLDEVALLAFGTMEEAADKLQNFRQEEIDTILSAIHNAYIQPPKKSKGD
jgi:hypothetical protein